MQEGLRFSNLFWKDSEFHCPTEKREQEIVELEIAKYEVENMAAKKKREKWAAQFTFARKRY